MSSQPSPQFPDEKGLLWSYRLDGQGGGAQQGRLGGETAVAPAFDWFHLRSDEPDTLRWLREKQLDAQVIEALTASETRPRMALIAGGVLINLRGVNTNPGSDPHDMISIRTWFNESIVISTRRRTRRLLSVEDIRRRIGEGQGPHSTGEFIAILTEHLANRIGDVVDDIDEGLTRIETDLDEQRIKLSQQQLFNLRKQAAEIRRYLAPQREALLDLYRSRNFLSDKEVVDLQYQTDRIIHYVEDLDLARERAVMLQGELQNLLAVQQNARMYVLSVVAAIFLPLSFLTGLFGMNVAGLPGLENPNAFLLLSFGMVAVAVALIVFMRWKKWI